MGVEPYKRGPGTKDHAADFARGLEEYPQANGQLRSVELDGTSNTQFFDHGLERAFRGTQLWGSSVTTARLHLLRPEDVEQAGRDPRKVFAVKPSGAVSGDLDVWVF